MEQAIKSKVTYGQAVDLQNVIGKLKTKTLSNTNYIEMIQFKRRVKAGFEDFKEMEKQVYDDFKVDLNFDGSLNIKQNELEKINNMDKALKELSRGEFDISGTNFIKLADFEAIRQSNDLTLDEEDLLVEWLVDTTQPLDV